MDKHAQDLSAHVRKYVHQMHVQEDTLYILLPSSSSPGPLSVWLLVKGYSCR